MSKPAVLASRAISTPRTRRIVIEATTSLRASFSLTRLRTTSFARTELTPACTFAVLWIGQFDRQHHVAQALAVDVLRQRDRDAAAERVLDDEIERLEIAQRVAPDRAFGDVLEGFRHALRRQFAREKIPMLGVVADDRNIRRVAFVAGARMGEIVDADAHSAPSTTTWALTRFSATAPTSPPARRARAARRRHRRRPGRACAWRVPRSRWHARPCARACVQPSAVSLHKVPVACPPGHAGWTCRSNRRGSRHRRSLATSAAP